MTNRRLQDPFARIIIDSVASPIKGDSKHAQTQTPSTREIHSLESSNRHKNNKT